VDAPAARGPQRLRPAQRIKRRPEFQRIYEQGVKLHGRFMTLFILPNGRQDTRLGIAATRRLGGAVRRNRAKRLVRELFRRNPAPAGLDIVVNPRRELLEGQFASLEADYTALLRRGRRRS
jgi:ribonuclease P protein component